MRKLSTAGGVFKSRGLRGVARIVAEKIGTWWRQGNRWEVARLVGAGSDVVRLDGCVFVTDSPAISTHVKELLQRGSYEKPERVALKRFLDPGLPVVEFGACLGIVSCSTNKRLHNPQRHVVVEANPDLLPLIEENRRRNGCHFTLLHAAVGYGSDEVAFYVSDDAIVSSLRRPTGRAVSVPAVTLRDIIDQFGFRRCTLICDIEGGELDLVRCEADLLSERVSTIIIEVHNRLVGDEPTKSMLLELERVGFRLVYKNWDTYVLENGKTGAA